MVDGEFIVTEETILCAFDYALGRRTYVVASVIRDLQENSEELSQRTRQYMIKKIWDKRVYGELGHPRDAEQWRNLHQRLSEIESEGQLL